MTGESEGMAERERIGESKDAPRIPTVDSPSDGVPLETRSEYLQVLLVELENANLRIGAYFEIQTKVLGVAFATLAAVLGWLFLGESHVAPGSQEMSLVLLLVVVVSSFSVLLGNLYNGFALGYIDYKARVLGPEVRRILDLETNPLSALASTQDSPARAPILFATAALAVAHSMIGFGAFGYATWTMASSGAFSFPMALFASGALVLLIASVIAQSLFSRGLTAVRQRVRETDAG